MPKYIEFIGPSAIGKTTVYNFLKTKHTTTDKWIPADKISTDISIRRKLKNIIKKILNHKTVAGYQNINTKILERFTENNPGLMEILWQTLPFKQKEINGKDFRIHSLLILIRRFIKIQSLKEFDSTKYCILDEGVLQSISYFLDKTSSLSFEERISKLFDNIEMPDGVVFFDGNINVITERYRLRKKILPHDKNLSVAEFTESKMRDLEIKRKCCEIISAKKGTPVLHLSGAESIQAKAGKIIAFIDALDKPDQFKPYPPNKRIGVATINNLKKVIAPIPFIINLFDL